MNSSPTPLSIGHIMISDFRLNQLIAMAVLMTLFGIGFSFFTSYRLFGLIALTLGISASVALIIRINWYQSILDVPFESTATIERIGRSWLPRRGRYRYTIHYRYTHNGISYQRTTQIYSYPDVITMQVDDEVRLLMHREKPGRSLLPGLFAD